MFFEILEIRCHEFIALKFKNIFEFSLALHPQQVTFWKMYWNGLNLTFMCTSEGSMQNNQYDKHFSLLA